MAGGLAAALMPQRAAAQQYGRPNYYKPSNYGTPNSSTYRPSNYVTQPV